MASITFTPSSVAQLYYVSCDAEGVTRQVVYLLPRNTSAQSPFGLQESWMNYPASCYIFLAKAVDASSDAENAFSLSTWNFLEDASNQGVRFTWFADPANINLGVDNVSLPVYTSDNVTYYTAKAISFSLRNFQVLIGRDCQVAVGTDGSSFTFTKPTDQESNLALLV